MILINDEKNCCGCASCADVCPAGCITLTGGVLGSLIAKADASKCIGCNRCESVCPMNHKVFLSSGYSQKVYAAYAKDKEVRGGGSSGGMFGTFAYHLLDKGYEIYGAAFDENLRLHHTCATNHDELAPLFKSKYIQSDMSTKYREIKEKLDSGKNIMFVSTPCQVTALHRFLQKSYDNLITVDLLCKGVPSQELFDKCLDYEEKKRGCKTKSFQFRAKYKGPNTPTPHCFNVVFEKGKKEISYSAPYYKSVYYAIFQQYSAFRESCYRCPFSTSARNGDVTIGDFHTIDKFVNNINRFEGVSSVVINSDKGQALFDEIKKDIWFYETEFDSVLSHGALFEEKKKSKDRDAIIKSYSDDPFDAFVKKRKNPKKYIISGIYYSLPLSVRKILKKAVRID